MDKHKNFNLTQFLRKDLQEKLVQGKVSSLLIQAVSLIHFAQHLGYEPVHGNVKKGFVKCWLQKVPKDDGIVYYKRTRFMSLRKMQEEYNTPFSTMFKSDYKIVSRVSFQYNKRTTKELTSELHWLKFLGKEE